MNLVVLTGRVTKEVEVRYTTGDNPLAMAKFSLAVDKPQKGKGTDFIGCVIWGKSAEAFAKYVQKGQKVLVSGSWFTGSYQGKNGKVYTNECNVSTWEFADGGKRDNSDSMANNGSDSSIPDNLDFMDIGGMDEIPFA